MRTDRWLNDRSRIGTFDNREAQDDARDKTGDSFVRSHLPSPW